MSLLKVGRLFRFFRWLFRRRTRLKAYILDSKYRVVPAFSWAGEDYYCFDSAYDTPTGRALAAMTIMTELEMRVDEAYLTKHIRACEILLNKGKLVELALINNNLKERLTLAPFPDHIYKLASVSYFTAQESPYSYDFVYNAAKIKKWKEANGTLDFFLKGPLKTLMPFIQQGGELSSQYFQTAESVNQLHQKDLHSVISKAGPPLSIAT